MKESKTKLIIILLLITMISLVSIIAVLYVTTDMFKSSETLFKKYIGQNLEDIAFMFNFEPEEISFDKLQNEDFSENADITLTYLEKEDDKEEVFNIEEDGVIENVKEKAYRNIKISYNDEELSKIELLKENELYGFRLANIVQQFVSVKNENLSYFISSMGYNGEYFSEKLNKVDMTGLSSFSIDEINKLGNNYVSSIFNEINKDSYYTKHNVMITLSNEQSVTATAHVLNISQNDFDKICKRILNKAVEDENILGRIDQIDNKIKELGIIEPEGQSLRELYIAKLKELLSGLQYNGTTDGKIIITAYEIKGDVVRIAIQKTSPNCEYILDTENGVEGCTLVLQIGKQTEEGMDIKSLKLNKKTDATGYIRGITYENNEEKLEMTLKTTVEENQLQVNGDLNYTGNDIYSLTVNADANVNFSTGSSSQISFNDNNNIILNNYEGNKIPSILENLQSRFIKKLGESQSKINSKLLNNILIWVDKIQTQKENNRKQEAEDKKEAFNNQFVLYSGQNLQYSHIQKLMELVSENMETCKVISGSKIRIGIKQGVQNKEKAEELVNIMDEKHTYNVSMFKDKDGYLQYIDIEIYKKPENN